jgi:hypothetical protein
MIANFKVLSPDALVAKIELCGIRTHNVDTAEYRIPDLLPTSLFCAVFDSVQDKTGYPVYDSPN